MFDFQDSGTGPALLFLPGSYSTHAAWKGVQAALQGNYRLISTSLPGYGGSTEVRPQTVFDTALMTDFVARVVDLIGEPVHLIGHSWGGLVAYATMLGQTVTPLSLITFEGNPVFSRDGDSDFPWLAKVMQTNARFETACAANDPDAAAIIIDYWSMPGFFNAMPPQVQAYCRATAHTNLLDWRSAAGFAPQLADYGAIDAPCTILRGEFANPAIVDISRAIAANVPNASLKTVRGAGHFLITTHAADCAAIIDRHMQDFAAHTP